MEEVLIPFATQSGVVIMAFIDISVRAMYSTFIRTYLDTFRQDTLF